MDKTQKFELDPLPLECEFKVESVKHRIHQLNKKELENFLGETLSLLVKVTHQTKQMRTYIESLQGKIDIDDS